jgi:AcrR family transcriptional regulator
MEVSSNPKRDQILRTGKELFWKHGFRRVSIEEICREAGVSKMTFYKYFPNKIELVKTLMDGIMQNAVDKYIRIRESSLSYPEKVIQMIELKREQTHAMSTEFFKDYLQSGDPELISYLEKLSGETFQMFTDDLRRAQENGDIRKDLKVEFIMAILNHLVDIVQHDEALLGMYEEPQDLAVEMTTFLFYGILNRDVHQ